MQTSLDRQRLLKMYHDDPTLRTWLVMFRCTAGLAIIGLIAVIGLSDQTNAPDISTIATMKAPANAPADPRRQVVKESQLRLQVKDQQRPATYADVGDSNANGSRPPFKHP